MNTGTGSTEAPLMAWPKCGICGEMMPDQAALDGHMGQSHPKEAKGGQPLEAVVAEVEVKRKEEAMTKCGICGKGFLSARSMGGHVAKAHPGGKAQEEKPKPRRGGGRRCGLWLRSRTVEASTDGNGILGRLKACADEHRRKADEIERQIAEFTEAAKKLL